MNIRVATIEDIQTVVTDTPEVGGFSEVPEEVNFLYTLEDEGRILAVGGFKMLNPRTAWCGFKPTAVALESPKHLVRVLHGFMREVAKAKRLHRLMAAVDIRRPEAIRTMEHLAFAREATMKGYFGPGHDAALYVRLFTVEN